MVHVIHTRCRVPNLWTSHASFPLKMHTWCRQFLKNPWIQRTAFETLNLSIHGDLHSTSLVIIWLGYLFLQRTGLHVVFGETPLIYVCSTWPWLSTHLSQSDYPHFKNMQNILQCFENSASCLPIRVIGLETVVVANQLWMTSHITSTYIFWAHPSTELFYFKSIPWNLSKPN